MVPDAQSEAVSRILAAVREGDGRAADELLPLVYEELRRMAHARLARLAPGQTIEPTALVHDVYLKLVGEERVEWSSLGCFFGAAARSMRNLLVDRARGKASHKRGGAARRVSLEVGELAAESEPQELLALDTALEALERHDQRKHEVVLLRYFAGLSIEDTAKALGLSHASVERDWTYARAWLRRRMSAPAG